MILRIVPLALVVGLLGAHDRPVAATRIRPRIVVGAVEDAAKSGDPEAKMALPARPATGRSCSAPSGRRRSRPRRRRAFGAPEARDAAARRRNPPDPRRLLRSARSRRVTGGARRSSPPTPPRSSRSLPAVRDVIIGNEPNLNLFWMPQFAPTASDVAATAYLALLAETYDALKRYRRSST